MTDAAPFQPGRCSKFMFETFNLAHWLHEEGYLHISKGPFKAIFKTENNGMRIEFDPQLPETSRTTCMQMPVPPDR